MREMTWNGWVVATIVTLAIIALLAWARNDPGIDDRVPDPEDAVSVVTVNGVQPSS